MDEDSKLIRMLIIGVVVVALSLVGSCQSTNYQIRKMVEAGAHPALAACAISSEKSCSALAVIELEKLRGSK